MKPKKQIFRLRLTSDDAPDFFLELHTPSNATFQELNDAIIRALQYDPSEMTSFAICDRHWVQMSEVHLFEPPFSDPDLPAYLMSETTLDAFFPHQSKQGTFTFDILGDRLFYMEIVQTLSETSVESGVTLFALKGTPPNQTSDINALLRDNFVNKHRLISDNADIDDEYGFGIDEFELEGFDFSDEP